MRLPPAYPIGAATGGPPLLLAARRPNTWSALNRLEARRTSRTFLRYLGTLIDSQGRPVAGCSVRLGRRRRRIVKALPGASARHSARRQSGATCSGRLADHLSRRPGLLLDERCVRDDWSFQRAKGATRAVLATTGRRDGFHARAQVHYGDDEPPRSVGQCGHLWAETARSHWRKNRRGHPPRTSSSTGWNAGEGPPPPASAARADATSRMVDVAIAPDDPPRSAAPWRGWPPISCVTPNDDWRPGRPSICPSTWFMAAPGRTHRRGAPSFRLSCTHSSGLLGRHQARGRPLWGLPATYSLVGSSAARYFPGLGLRPDEPPGHRTASPGQRAGARRTSRRQRGSGRARAADGL